MSFSRETTKATLNALQLVMISTNTVAGNPFGPNVFVFNPSMSAATIQSTLDYLFSLQNDSDASQFDVNR